MGLGLDGLDACCFLRGVALERLCTVSSEPLPHV